MQVEGKYMRMQILCMHKPRWRRDLIAFQHKPATLARLLGISHRSCIFLCIASSGACIGSMALSSFVQDTNCSPYHVGTSVLEV